MRPVRHKDMRNAILDRSAEASAWLIRLTLALALVASGPVNAVMRPGSFDTEEPHPNHLRARTLAERAEEVMTLKNSVPLGAIVPFLAQFDSVRTSGPTPLARSHHFLDRVADVVLAQFPSDIAVRLRQLYFYNENLKFSNDLWRETEGRSLVRADTFATDNFRLEVASELQSTPLLLKINKIVGLVQLGQQMTLVRAHPGVPYRSLSPVIHAINQITGWLVADDVLRYIPEPLLRSEISSSNMDATKQSFVLEDFIPERHLSSRVLSGIQGDSSLSWSEMIRWVLAFRETRVEQAKKLPSESQLLAPLTEALEKSLRAKGLGEGRQYWFRAAHEARKVGDERSGKVLRQLFHLPEQCQEIF